MRLDPEAAMAALRRAEDAEDRIRPGREGDQLRCVRDEAVMDALRAGMSLEQVADELGVPISDLPCLTPRAASTVAAT
jgi:hypothetical protein